jgi:HEPN domain-containing protein
VIPVEELQKLSLARLDDAVALEAAGRFDGAMYVCGYAVELGLKARICKTLKWMDFPETRSEFQDYGSLKTHSLGALIRFSGVETEVKSTFVAEWSVLIRWSPEMRYRYANPATASDAQQMIRAARLVLSSL